MVLTNANPIPPYMIESSGNATILLTPKSSKLLSLLDCKWAMKFYFLDMKSNEVGTTLKHLGTINGNVKNLSKRIKTFIFYPFTLRI